MIVSKVLKTKAFDWHEPKIGGLQIPVENRAGALSTTRNHE